MITKISRKLDFNELQRRIKINKDLSNFNYRGERTFIVVSGFNSEILNLRKIKGLDYYEERMLFYLFLLRYNKTRIVYITSKGFNTKLFDYYLGLISDNKQKIEEMKSRLIHIEVDYKANITIPLTNKILKDSKALNKIKKSILNIKTTQLRCFKLGKSERNLAVKLQVPAFGSKEKFDYLGTKSGGRKVFYLAKLNTIPGYSYLKNLTELSIAMAKLLIHYPYYKKLMVKLDTSGSGRGNAIFFAKEFLKENHIEISIKTDQKKLARTIRQNFCKYISFQMRGQECKEYLDEFNKNHGIVELYIPGEEKYSPSVQMSVSPAGKISIISTHEQILGGPDKQEYLGCRFPSLDAHRDIIIKEALKVGKWMAKKGMMGYFAIDFVVVYKEGKLYKVYPIEINLRKGGTTHPFRIAYYLTGAIYNPRKGMLACGDNPVYYYAMDKIENKLYKKLKPMELVELVHNSRISFNKDTKRGVLVYMPGMVQKYGKFGAICIGNSRKETEILYKKLLKLVDKYVESK